MKVVFTLTFMKAEQLKPYTSSREYILCWLLAGGCPEFFTTGAPPTWQPGSSKQASREGKTVRGRWKSQSL